MEKQNKADRAIYLISLLMIALGVLVRLVAFLYNRSLFLDEAYLASSVVQRNYIGLFRPLDFNQAAPLGFLWLAKTSVYLFGPSEYSLRLVSLLAGIGAIPLFYSVLKNAFEDQRPHIGTAFFATIPFLIYYSIEFKPYMLDACVTLLSIYMFSLAIKRKIRTWILCVHCASVLWFSFPVLFTVAAFCITWIGYSALKRQEETLKTALITSGISLVSFGLFFVMGSQIAQTNQEQSLGAQYWDLIRFPLIPSHLKELRLIYQIGMQYFGAFDKGSALLMLLLTGLALMTRFGSKKWWGFSVFFAVEILFLLVASWLGRYGMVTRLLLFIIPLHVLFVSGIISNLWYRWRIAAVSLSLVFVIANIGSARYFLPGNVFRAKQEVNPVLGKLESLDKSIPLYVYAHAIPQYEFKTGYRMSFRNTPSSPIEKDNTIYGSYFFNYQWRKPFVFESEIDPVRLDQNARAIEAHNQAYLLFAVYDTLHRDALSAALRKSGSITEILNIYETPLYLYHKY